MANVIASFSMKSFQNQLSVLVYLTLWAAVCSLFFTRHTRDSSITWLNFISSRSVAASITHCIYGFGIEPTFVGTSPYNIKVAINQCTYRPLAGCSLRVRQAGCNENCHLLDDVFHLFYSEWSSGEHCIYRVTHHKVSRGSVVVPSLLTPLQPPSIRRAGSRSNRWGHRTGGKRA